MRVEEAFKILKDPKMAKKQCNFKITETKGTNKITLVSINKKLDSFIKEQRQFNKIVLAQFKKHGWIK